MHTPTKKMGKKITASILLGLLLITGRVLLRPPENLVSVFELTSVVSGDGLAFQVSPPINDVMLHVTFNPVAYANVTTRVQVDVDSMRPHWITHLPTFRFQLSGIGLATHPAEPVELTSGMHTLQWSVTPNAKGPHFYHFDVVQDTRPYRQSGELGSPRKYPDTVDETILPAHDLEIAVKSHAYYLAIKTAQLSLLIAGAVLVVFGLLSSIRRPNRRI
jgi:hypothetical protein